jgi:flagellar biosynthetic protein FliQ
VTEADLAILMRESMLVLLKLVGPLLLVSLTAGLIVAFIQAITQINEATLAFIPKLAALGITLLVLGSFMQATLSEYTRAIYDQIVAIGAS